MIKYFKNLTTFRVLFLLLIAMSLALYIYDAQHGARMSKEFAQKGIFQKLLESTDNFSANLAAQEALAVALAVQFEMLDAPHESGAVIDQILERMVAASPAYVQGLGMTISGYDGVSSVLTYLSKKPMDADMLAAAGTVEESGVQTLTAREVNMERNLNWRLMSSHSGENDQRFSTFLSVAMMCAEHSQQCGTALVTADLDWLIEILGDLESSGAVYPMCASPDLDIMWLENGGLHLSRGRRTGTGSEKTIVARTKKFLYSGVDSGAGNNSFLKSDILGTGWRLIVPNPILAENARPWSSLLPLFLFLAVAALFTEGIISSLRTSGGAQEEGVGNSGKIAASSARETNRGLLPFLHRLLFKYRITNPEHERMESELRVAREIQYALVPATFPAYSEWREFDLHSALRTAREVGGDYYDFFQPTPDRLVLTVGDVSGKGFPAALYMAVCRTAFRALAREATSPGQLLTSLNDVLVRDNASGRYVTTVCFFIDLPTGKCEYAIAGHPAPLCFRATRGAVEFVDSPRETFIGLKAGLDFPVGKMLLAKGDTLLLYTDGVSEARNPKGEELEYEGLRHFFMEAVKEKRCSDVLESLENSMNRYVANTPQTDDITLLAFRYWGPGGQKTLKKIGGKTTNMTFGNAAHAGVDYQAPLNHSARDGKE